MTNNILPIFTIGCAAIAGIVVVTAFYTLERKIMGINEELSVIRDRLNEASNEILAKIDELEDQLSNKESVDPALLGEVRGLAESLANVVPNVTPGEDPKPIVPGEDLKPIVEDEELTPTED